jgi:poly-gamma-glutamate synthesis protein (capsule biosynthesis protein)
MVEKKQEMISLYAVGDVCVNRDNPESIFALSASVLNEPDIAFCPLETMYSERGAPSIVTDVPLRAHPRNVSALTFAGFDVVSMAGNHCLDWGDDALIDTIELLKRNNMHVVGVGKNIAEARKPVIIEKKGVRIAFLAYNSIMHQRYWADTNKPGCAPMRAFAVYEPFEPHQPGTPVRILTFADKQDLEAMENDIMNTRKSADVVIISLHWGLHFAPGALAMYQKEVGHAAIDAGADLILGHHAHILKGIEVYKGKVIAYSLCNFAFDLNLTPDEKFDELLLQYRLANYAFDLYSNEGDFKKSKHKELPKVYPNRIYLPEDYPTYVFPVDSRKTILLKCSISKKGIEKVSFLPVFINPQGQPEILTRQNERSVEVFNYMKNMCEEMGTNLSFERGDEVLIHIK